MFKFVAVAYPIRSRCLPGNVRCGGVSASSREFNSMSNVFDGDMSEKTNKDRIIPKRRLKVVFK